jgi:peptidylprolyl isomerase domain and WD repeat-containing protein 1
MPLVAPGRAFALTGTSSDQASGVIRIYDARGDGTPVETVDKVHRSPVHLMTVRTR